MTSSQKKQKEFGKGQRSIHAFFTPKAGSEPKTPAAAGPSKQPPAETLQPPVVDLTASTEDARPAKRARTGSQAPAKAPAKESQQTADVAGGAQPASTSASARSRPSSSARPATADPAQRAALHDRWQNKLVEGQPLRRYGDAPGGQAAIVPQKYTPLELQILDLKKKHPGVLLVVEVGYKMRFFGDDAEVASRILNVMAFPDRNFFTCMIPVPRLHICVRRLVEAGYKVGVVRQRETAAMKAVGDNRYAPFTRELTALYTRSTLEAGNREDVGEGPVNDRGANDAWSSERLSSYLVCLVEAPAPSRAGASAEIGIVAVETSTGDVLYDQFTDGMMRSKLESRLMYAAPSDLLVARPISAPTNKLLAAYAAQTAGLRSETVQQDKYAHGGGLAAVTAFYGAAGTPDEARALDAVMGMPPLVVQALAHALDFLTPFGLQAVLRLGASFRAFRGAQELALSPNALRQLEILRNSDDGSERGSLLWLLSHTKTASGGRLLRHWIAHPLRDIDRINERLDAVGELMASMEAPVGDPDGASGGGALAALPRMLAKLPDLERGITRIFHRTINPSEFVAMLRALAAVGPQLGVTAAETLDGALPADAVGSALLQRLLQEAAAPEVADKARRLLGQLDAGAAQRNERLSLFACEERFPDVFARQRELAAAEAVLQDMLPPLRRQLRLPRLEYTSITNQGDWLLEVPAERTDVPKEWELVCSTKKVKRYRPPAVKAAVQALDIARERLQAACDAAWLDYLAEAAEGYSAFRAAVQALAALDVLLSLATVSCGTGYVRPQFVDEDEQPQLHIEAGRHPVLDAVMAGTVVPNDTQLSGDGRRVLVVTGPNMGGKSCYIRMNALLAILAQVGCYVPARSARLHVVDAIFTRMGASDNLALGRSTFLEELTEASEILASATPRSLVIVDELGRGTATHDGLAIALATLQHLVTHTRCLTLFVTHYPEVADLRREYPQHVGAGCMAYLAEEGAIVHAEEREQQDTDPSSAQASGSGRVHLPRLTFLYKLVEGVADKSFGLNVASLAHLPASVIERAAQKAAWMEQQAVSDGAVQSRTNGPLTPPEEQALQLVDQALTASHDGEALASLQQAKGLVLGSLHSIGASRVMAEPVH